MSTSTSTRLILAAGAGALALSCALASAVDAAIHRGIETYENPNKNFDPS